MIQLDSVWQRRDEVVAPTAAAAASISSSEAPGRPKANVAHAAGEEEALALPSQRLLAHIAQVVAVDQYPALLGVVEARNRSLWKVDLPAPATSASVDVQVVFL